MIDHLPPCGQTLARGREKRAFPLSPNLISGAAKRKAKKGVPSLKQKISRRSAKSVAFFADFL